MSKSAAQDASGNERSASEGTGPETPKLTVDGIIIVHDHVLLIQRHNPPFEGGWAFPGGFVDVGERIGDAVVREVAEETGLDVVAERIVGVYSDPQRDPRRHTTTVAFLCRPADATDAADGAGARDGLPDVAGDDDAADAAWYPLDAMPTLAFDHARILADARRAAATASYHDACWS